MLCRAIYSQFAQPALHSLYKTMHFAQEPLGGKEVPPRPSATHYSDLFFSAQAVGTDLCWSALPICVATQSAFPETVWCVCM